MLEKLKATTLADVWRFGKKVAGVAAALAPFLTAAYLWAASTLDARAQQYVKDVIAPEISGLAAKIDESNTEQRALVEQVQSLTESLNSVVRAQSAEVQQSSGEAAVNRQILCLLKNIETGASEPCE